jgi:hypothetical protein
MDMGVYEPGDDAISVQVVDFTCEVLWEVDLVLDGENPFPADQHVLDVEMMRRVDPRIF